MKNQVTVTADKNGQVFFPNAKPGKDGKIYGYVRLEQVTLDLDSSVATKKTVSMLKQFEASAANMLEAGDTVNGKLIQKDSLTPWFADQEPLQVPVKPGSDELRTVTSGGQPVYRITEFTSNLEKSSAKLAYDKVRVEATILS